MPYVRKTYDEWEVETNYGYGWDTEFTATSATQAKQIKRDYLENARGLIGIRIKKHRIKKGV